MIMTLTLIVLASAAGIGGSIKLVKRGRKAREVIRERVLERFRRAGLAVHWGKTVPRHDMIGTAVVERTYSNCDLCGALHFALSEVIVTSGGLSKTSNVGRFCPKCGDFQGSGQAGFFGTVLESGTNIYALLDLLEEKAPGPATEAFYERLTETERLLAERLEAVRDRRAEVAASLGKLVGDGPFRRALPSP